MPEILDDPAGSGKMRAVVVEDTVLPVASPSASGPAASSLPDRDVWGLGPFHFRFRLANLRPGRGFAQRRFSIAEAAALFLLAYFASRGLGLVRQVIFNTIFGATTAANAYYAAFNLPDTLFNLIAGGALIQAFIPVFVSYERERGREETWYLVSLVFNVLLVTLTALVLIGEFTAPAFVSHWLVPGYSPATQGLTTTLTRIMLVQPLLLGIGSIMTALLNSKRQFLLPALSIAVYNIGLIGGLLVSLAVPGVGIYGPTVGVVVSAVLHVLVLIPGLTKQGVQYTFAWNLKNAGLRDVLYLLGPNVISVAVVAVGLVVDTAFTSTLRDKASLSAIHNAYLLFDVPAAFLGQTLGLIALPQMARLATDRQYVQLRRLTAKIVVGAVAVSVPIALLLYFVGKPGISILFQHGAFTKHASSLTALALFGYAVGLPGRIASGLLARSFYAVKNAVTPLIINIFGFAAHLGLLLLLLRLLSGKYVILAIPLSAGGAAAFEAGMLGLLLFFTTFKHLLRKHEALAADGENVADDNDDEVDEF